MKQARPFAATTAAFMLWAGAALADSPVSVGIEPPVGIENPTVTLVAVNLKTAERRSLPVKPVDGAYNAAIELPEGEWSVGVVVEGTVREITARNGRSIPSAMVTGTERVKVTTDGHSPVKLAMEVRPDSFTDAESCPSRFDAGLAVRVNALSELTFGLWPEDNDSGLNDRLGLKPAEVGGGAEPAAAAARAAGLIERAGLMLDADKAGFVDPPLGEDGRAKIERIIKDLKRIEQLQRELADKESKETSALPAEDCPPKDAFAQALPQDLPSGGRLELAQRQGGPCNVGTTCDFVIEITNNTGVAFDGPLVFVNVMPVNVDIDEIAESWSCLPGRRGETWCLSPDVNLVPGGAMDVAISLSPRERLPSGAKDCVQLGWPRLDLPLGEDRFSVQYLQFVTAANGYEPGPIDGVPGRRTREAFGAAMAAAGNPRDADISGERLFKALFGRDIEVPAGPPGKVCIDLERSPVPSSGPVIRTPTVKIVPKAGKQGVGVSIGVGSGNQNQNQQNNGGGISITPGIQF